MDRRSWRTGAWHPLGGFVDLADYAGDSGDFMPYLRAVQGEVVVGEVPPAASVVL